MVISSVIFTSWKSAWRGRRDGMLLDLVNHDRLRSPRSSGRERVAPGTAAQVLELLRIDLDRLGRLAVAIDHGGQDARRAAGWQRPCR